MDKLTKYRQVIRQTLSRYAVAGFGNSPDLKMRVAHDRDTDDFFLTMQGWSKNVYRHGLLIHLQIVDGKIWLHENRTDFDLLDQFRDAGIPKSDIVLGFVEPILRTESEFTVA